MKKIFLLVLPLFLIFCKKNRSPIVEDTPRSISAIRQLGFYEYNNIGLNSANNKNIFFSNIKPDYILKDRKNYPLGRLRHYMKKNPGVLKYFDKQLHAEFIYYHYRNDSSVSRLYVLDNRLINNNEKKITTVEKAKQILNSSSTSFDDKKNYDNLLRKKYNISRPITDDIILINNQFPAIIHASSNLFFIEVFYNKAIDNNSIWVLEH